MLKRTAVPIAAALLMAGLFSCRNPLTPVGTDPVAEEDPAPITAPRVFEPTVEYDPEIGQAVFVTTHGRKIRIESAEYSGTDEPIIIRCEEASDYILLDEPNDVPEGESWAVALVIGRRDDGKPGIWEVHSDDSTHPVIMSGDAYDTSELQVSDERSGAMYGKFGWTYYPEMFSEDFGIIVGRAVNEDGFEQGHWSIAPGTAVGVYWAIREFEHGRVVLVSKAKVIGTDIPFPGEPPEHSSRFWKGFWWFLNNRFKLFFLDWLERYLVTPDAVRLTDDEGVYEVTGTDQDGVPAIARLTKYVVLSIEDAETPKPDLTVEFTAPSYSALEGEDLLVTYIVTNLGDIAPAGGMVALYLSDDSVLDPSDTLVSSESVDGIAPGTGAVMGTVFNIPDPGIYTVFAVVDPDGEVDEYDEGNNTAFAQITINEEIVVITGPDLIPISMSYPGYGIPLISPVTVTVNIRNTGAEAVMTPFDVDLYLSTDSIFDPSADRLLATIGVKSTISGSSTLTLSREISLNNLPSGECVLIYAVVDSGNTVAETDESNNTSTEVTAAGAVVTAGAGETYDLIVETYPSTVTSATNAPDTFMYVYDESGNELYSGDSGGIGSFAAVNISVPSGTYYVLVYGFSSGSYATMVRSTNLSSAYFPAELSGEADDPVKGDDTVPPAMPAVFYDLKAGETVNRYIGGGGDFDWFRLVLP